MQGTREKLKKVQRISAEEDRAHAVGVSKRPSLRMPRLMLWRINY